MTNALPKILAVFAMVALLAFAFTHSCYRTFQPYNYKLTVNLESNGHIYSGSSVIRNIDYGIRTIDGTSGGYHIRGQAVIINIGNNRPIFVLLPSSPQDDDQPTRVLLSAYGIRVSNIWKSPGLSELIRQRGERLITDNELPTMVTFADLKNPRSIQYIDPHDMTPSLGYDVHYVSSSISIVDEPITKGITKILPWLHLSGKSPSVGLLYLKDRWGTPFVITDDSFAKGVS